MAARLGSVDSVAGHARPRRRVGRDRCARAIAGGRGGLGGSPAGPSRIGWPLGGAAFVPRAWISTNDTLQLLRDLGVDPTSDRVRRAITQVRERCKWGEEFGDSPFFDGEVEPCINGRVLAAGAYFGAASDRLVDRLLQEQLTDGGWNCDAPRSQRSSFHTTICVCSKDCWSTSGRRVRCLTSPALAFADRNISSSAACQIAIDWTDCQLRSETPDGRRLDAVFVSHALALRHPVGARLPAPSGRRARRAHRRGGRSGGEEARRGRTMAARESASGSVHFEMEGRSGEPSRWNTFGRSALLRWVGVDVQTS